MGNLHAILRVQLRPVRPIRKLTMWVQPISLLGRVFADTLDFGFYPLLDILTVVPVQLVFADRSVKINNRNIFITIVNYGFM